MKIEFNNLRPSPVAVKGKIPSWMGEYEQAVTKWTRDAQKAIEQMRIIIQDQQDRIEKMENE